MKMTGAQAIVKVLQEQGVETVFGYPGGAVPPGKSYSEPRESPPAP